MPGDTTVKEALLERYGSIDRLQRYRLYRWMKNGGSLNTDPVMMLLGVEGEIRQIVQKELSLKDKVKRIPEKDILGAESLYQELDGLSKEYWWLERKWWWCRGNFTSGPLTRAFELWRSHPRWYMHPVLREDCTNKGGCCGRGCGCCVNRAISPARQLGHGHCTVECACCRKARGFDFDTNQKKRVEEWFDYSPVGGQKAVDNKKMYLYRVYWASIWGIVVDSDKSPFDLVGESLKL